MAEKQPSMAEDLRERLEVEGLTMEDTEALLRPEDPTPDRSRQPTASKRAPADRAPRTRARSARPSRAGQRSREPVREAKARYKQLSYWLSEDEYFAMRKASMDREQKGIAPFHHEKMAKGPFREWLRREGYLEDRGAEAR